MSSYFALFVVLKLFMLGEFCVFLFIILIDFSYFFFVFLSLLIRAYTRTSMIFHGMELSLIIMLHLIRIVSYIIVDRSESQKSQDSLLTSWHIYLWRQLSYSPLFTWGIALTCVFRLKKHFQHMISSKIVIEGFLKQWQRSHLFPLRLLLRRRPARLNEEHVRHRLACLPSLLRFLPGILFPNHLPSFRRRLPNPSIGLEVVRVLGLRGANLRGTVLSIDITTKQKCGLFCLQLWKIRE